MKKLDDPNRNETHGLMECSAVYVCHCR